MHTFKSERHAQLCVKYPPEVEHCGAMSQRVRLRVQPAVFGPYRLPLASRITRALRDIATNFVSPIR